VVQVALATAEDAAAVAGRWSGAPAPRRPWLDPLPGSLALDELPGAERGIPFGLLDRPDEQRRELAVYEPELDGNLLVLGGHRSGKSGLLAALASAAGRAPGRPAAEVLPADPDSAWDLLSLRVSALRGGGAPPGLLLVDDVDLLLARTPDEHRQQLLDLLLELLRSGSSAGLAAVLSARRPSGGVQALAALCDSRVLLAMPDRQEHLVAGGESADLDPRLPPGGGRWRGARLQVATAEHRLIPIGHDPAPPARIEAPAAVICGDPVAVAERIPGSAVLSRDLRVGGDGGVLVGSPDDWNAEWALLGRMRSSGTVAVIGLSAAELRSLGGFRGAPPPLATPGSFWLLRSGAVSRARLG